MDFEAFSDAFGRCLACGEPCTSGGCHNPSCSRCRYKTYPIIRMEGAVVDGRFKTTGQIQAEILAHDLAEKLEGWAKALRAGQGYVIRTRLEDPTNNAKHATHVTEARCGEQYVEIVELQPDSE